jgi:hypothetical protein
MMKKNNKTDDASSHYMNTKKSATPVSNEIHEKWYNKTISSGPSCNPAR